ncbi:hypothetical protein HAX54_013092 [Datura stramonium]|uniref:Uncharacterized protein n=1 Tax=Datura stramonium TaxID=4076 RepID=A0ABS8RYN5_DATST|nr:hypothetical protein [Datura stramonium]
MTMKSLFMFYVVLLLVTFSVNHALELAHEGGGAIQERALISRLKYNVNPARKLLLQPDMGEGDYTGDDGDVGGGDGTGTGIGDGNGTGTFVGGGDGNGTGNFVGGGDGDGNGGNDGTGGDGGNSGGDGSENRIGPTSCSKDSILVNQGNTPPLPSGIPTYTVIIENACYSGSCSISNIHLSCGWFSSARLINPRVFRRLSYNDCLVNNGEPLNPGQSLTFQYANTYKYPLSVSSIDC